MSDIKTGVTKYSATKVTKSTTITYKRFIQMYPDVFRVVVQDLTKGERDLILLLLSNHVSEKNVFTWDRPNKEAIKDSLSISEGTLNNQISNLHKAGVLIKGFDKMRFLSPLLGFKSTLENRNLMIGVFTACGLIVRKDLVALAGCTWVDLIENEHDRKDLYREYLRIKVFGTKRISDNKELDNIASTLAIDLAHKV